MGLKIGDKIYCKKNLNDEDKNATCIKGKCYIVNYKDTLDTSYELFLDGNFSAWLRYGDIITSDKLKYIWDYFETKIERSKRIINGFKDRKTITL